MLRIEDDGHGIRAEDLPILCERFTTSKLQKYEDLLSIGTFGFRGEALASISHVAHVTVTTMTSNDSCASIAHYSEGKLQGDGVRPCAGTRGTTLMVENMFYNNPTRRQALGKESIEHSKVLEVVQRYAIHYPHVAFACRKFSGSNSSAFELSTTGGQLNSRDVIGTIWGQNLANELFPFEVKSEEPPFSCRGFASNPNHSARSSTLILFINNRLVDCAPLKRAVEAVYQPVLPRHQHPWVYLALDVDPATIDVNVHPTKMEVQFLHEEIISQRIQETLSSQLRTMGGSRSFSCILPSLPSLPSTGKASAFIDTSQDAGPPGLPGPTSQATPQRAERAERAEREDKSAPEDKATTKAAKAAAKPTRIRTDHTQMSLESIFRESQVQASQGSQAFQDMEPAPIQDAPLGAASKQSNGHIDLDGDEADGNATKAMNAERSEPSAERLAVFEEAQQLTSIEELRSAVNLASDENLSKLLNQSVYVGPVNRELILLQCGASLCLANLAIMARECAYQRLLRLIGGIGCITLVEPLPLKDLVQLGLRDPESGYDKLPGSDIRALEDRFVSLLLQKADLLKEYFMLEIEIKEDQEDHMDHKDHGKALQSVQRHGRLKTVPNALGLTSDVGCSFDGLPLFMLRLCTEINWNDEKTCLDGICQLAAEFCADLLLPDESLNATDAVNAAVAAGEFEDVATAAAKRPRTSQELQSLRWLHEAIRKDGMCKWPRSFAKDGTLLDLVSLDQLYKIFERC